jgi:hypothetical protein
MPLSRLSLKRFVVTHWRGEFSLPRSFWANKILLDCLVVPLGLVIFGPENTFMLIFSLALIFWQNLGIWRSANRHPNRFWGVVAQLAVCADWR